MFVPSLERRLELADLMRLPWALAQGKRMRSACDQGGHEIVVPSGGLALALEAGFQRGVGAREVEGDLRSKARFRAAVRSRTRLASSLNPTSSTQWRPFSIAQWLRMAEASCAGGSLLRER